MSDPSAQMLQVLTEMRDLLRLIAEPAIAERDKRLRGALRSISGSATGKKAKAALLMDGTRTQTQIAKECGINQGDLSVLVKSLKASGLLTSDPKQPKLSISIPNNFFEQAGDADE
jgi:DNA-binding MarR family transcriptional regulator